VEYGDSAAETLAETGQIASAEPIGFRWVRLGLLLRAEAATVLQIAASCA